MNEKMQENQLKWYKGECERLKGLMRSKDAYIEALEGLVKANTTLMDEYRKQNQLLTALKTIENETAKGV